MNVSAKIIQRLLEAAESQQAIAEKLSVSIEATTDAQAKVRYIADRDRAVARAGAFLDAARIAKEA
jgi:Trp operon repressor